MKQDTGSVLSLSFVDVLANSFASLLVLFFIMVALRGTLEWSQTNAPARGADNAVDEAVNPFLVLVKMTASPKKGDGSVPWMTDNDNRPSPWAKTNDDERAFTFRTAAGDDFAVLYADRPPPPDVAVLLRMVAPHAPGTIEVFEGGRRVLQLNFAAEAESVQVFPAQAAGGGP